MIIFYLVRHGNKVAVPFDPPLTDFGREQAKKTATLLADIPFVEVIVSPKLRTIQTAEIILEQRNLPLRTDQRLIERLEWEENETFDQFMIEWDKTDINRAYIPRKGKSSTKNGEDVKKMLEELLMQYSDGNILIVTHGGTIGDLLRNLFTEQGIEHKTDPATGARYIDIQECSVTVVKKSVAGYALEVIGKTTHLF